MACSDPQQIYQPEQNRVMLLLCVIAIGIDKTIMHQCSCPLSCLIDDSETHGCLSLYRALLHRKSPSQAEAEALDKGDETSVHQNPLFTSSPDQHRPFHEPKGCKDDGHSVLAQLC